MEDYRAKYYSCREIQKLLQKLYKKEVKLRTLRSWFQDVPIANQYDEKIRLYGIDIVETTLAEHGIYQPLQDHLLARIHKLEKGLEQDIQDVQDISEAQKYVKKILNKVKLKLISKFLLEKYGWRFDDAKLNQDLLLQYELLNDEQISLFTEDLKKANERIEELNTDYYFKKIELKKG
ncbi:hypothetical protein [Limosilactobacillus reuteri]|uniref:hypothetical protein n=1 Tax=Limosilactobacillus reuteri TaxID=1598 RepID=UPI00128C8616|nr:hypothetical protein [Limosilactobacillus reuteri]MQB77432.1 hypothetical protein [Limosilactobacillus reuteri]MQB99474.1 hypothetical protein [Limosilactobacillus reuteri]MQC01669.1 hypothetical protein [Limosilactobacillus reuteri]